VRTRITQGRSVFVALLAYIVLVSAVDAATSDEVIRLTPMATLAPIAAGALLTLRQTVVVCAFYLGLTSILYGVWHPGVSAPNQATIIGSAIVVVLASLGVCRVRLEREERIRRLRLTAGAAQRLLLRSLPLPTGDVVVDGFYVAAEKEALVGGDIYEVLATPYGTRLVIGDVRGKGLAAIGASAAVLTAFREAAYREPDLQVVVKLMEQGLLRYGNDAGDAAEEFVTALVVETMGPEALRVIDCGHVSPFVISGGEVVEVDIDDPGVPLGLSDLTSAPRRWQDIKVPTGGRVLMCTDGVLEARDADGAYYPLPERLNRWLHLPTGLLLERLRADLTRHAGGFLSDDAALLVVQR
jgi:serine phosphatase RsbU (regulator of sigma subunit)